MKLFDFRGWWQGLPQKTRVKLIAALLLVFAGPEILLLAPYAFEVAMLIDVFGLAFVLSVAVVPLRTLVQRLRSLLLAAWQWSLPRPTDTWTWRVARFDAFIGKSTFAVLLLSGVCLQLLPA